MENQSKIKLLTVTQPDVLLEGRVPNKQPAEEGARLKDGQECFVEELRNST